MNRLFNRRLEILKEIGIDGLHISKKGNYYVYLNKKSSDKTIIKTWYNVTKKQIGEVGEELTFPKSNNHLVLLTTNNNLYVDIGNGLKKLGFQGIIHTDYRNKLAKLYFYNKKYEWLLNYPQFDRLRIARQCNSLKELKHFFGYGFMSNSQFVNRFGTDEGLELLVLSHNIENKVAIANTKTPIQYLRDIMNMSKTLQEDIQIHKSESRNRQTHDYLVGLTTTSVISNETKMTLQEDNTWWNLF